jgi:hypothetical protein
MNGSAGSGASNSYSGSAVDYSVGGGGGCFYNTDGSSSSTYGSGGNGGHASPFAGGSGSGKQGVVIVRYLT